MKKRFVISLAFLMIFAVSVYAADLDTAIRNADQKLKANGFLLSEEIEEIWENETTPDVIEKLSASQQESILAEYKAAQDSAAKSSLEFGTSITDELERSMYQDGVRKNKLLKATRAIAEKHGIKAGDIFVIEFHSVLNQTK